jgi:hypothetical protein
VDFLLIFQISDLFSCLVQMHTMLCIILPVYSTYVHWVYISKYLADLMASFAICTSAFTTEPFKPYLCGMFNITFV